MMNIQYIVFYSYSDINLQHWPDNDDLMTIIFYISFELNCTRFNSRELYFNLSG